MLIVRATELRLTCCKDEFRMGKDKAGAGYSNCSQRELLMIGTRRVIPAAPKASMLKRC